MGTDAEAGGVMPYARITSVCTTSFPTVRPQIRGRPATYTVFTSNTETVTPTLRTPKVADRDDGHHGDDDVVDEDSGKPAGTGLANVTGPASIISAGYAHLARTPPSGCSIDSMRVDLELPLARHDEQAVGLPFEWDLRRHQPNVTASRRSGVKSDRSYSSCS